MHQSLRLSDPRGIWIGAALLVTILFATAPAVALMLLMAVIAAMVTAPIAHKISDKTGLSYASAAAIMVVAVTFVVAVLLFLVLPLLVAGLKQMAELLPTNSEQLKQILTIIREELEGVFSPEAVDEALKKLKEMGAGHVIGSLSIVALKKIALAVGHFFIYVVFYLMLIFEWDQITQWLQERVRLAFPDKADEIEWLMPRFQENLFAICKGIVWIMAVFAPVYGFIFWILGTPLERSVVYGLSFGILGGIPLVGGILMYAPMWVSGFVEFVWPAFTFSLEVFRSPGAMKLYMLIAASLVGHILEAKLVTPKFVGHSVRVVAIAILVPLLVAAINLGLIKGLVIGFTAIAFMKAWDQMVLHFNQPEPIPSTT